MGARNGEMRFEDLKDDVEKLEDDLATLKKELNEEDKELVVRITRIETTLEDIACDTKETKSKIAKIEGEVRENRERSLENSWKTKILWGMLIGGTGAVATVAGGLIGSQGFLDFNGEDNTRINPPPVVRYLEEV